MKTQAPRTQVMDYKDIKIARLERNFRHLADETSARLHAEAKRTKALVKEAREASRPSADAQLAARTANKRGRAAVVSWDLGHNPVGRAYVLYRLLEKDWDVELIGPNWSRYGSELWAPLRDSGLNVRSFKCSTIEDFVPQAEVLAASTVYDIVYVCKPRLPSLYLGALIKDSSHCPMVVDVDDFELSFFRDETTATLADIRADLATAMHEPFEELATRYAQSLIPVSDAVTVSNVALREKFGGHIVRHARDEQEFCNTEQRRQAARERLGIAENDYALVFIGTPRPHKGVLEVARALEEIGDPSLVFHIVGDISDKKLRDELMSRSARVVLHPNCAFDELPDLLAGADLVPLIQDTQHAISQFQIPAKVSDALSLGIPVLATQTPPLKDLIAAGSVHATDLPGLASAICRLRDEATGGQSASRARRDFVNELGLTVNRARLEMAIEEAGQALREQQRDVGMAVDDSPWEPSLQRRETDKELRDLGEQRLTAPYADMVKLFRSEYRRVREQSIHAQQKSAGVDPSNDLPSRFPAIIRERSFNYDIAFFWKQNDSGLYGRRSDMIARYLMASGRVDRLLHFDAPKSIADIGRQFIHGAGREDDHLDLTLRNLVDRQAGIVDTEQFTARTFVGSGQARRGRLLGQPIYKRDAYVRFVNEQLEEAGMKASRTVAWFCPVIWDASELINKIGFGGVVSDLIDDQRAWDCKDKYRRKLEHSYRDTLKASDLVFANCDALAEAMSDYAPNIHVVPNGAERFSEFPSTDVPDCLKNIPGPIAGYVGNLRDRIDWMLLHQVVSAMPDVSFVFFGPSGDNANAESLAKHPNVHMLGLAPYAELHRYLRAFNVGLVPHLSNRLTESMNPLKVYNYFAAGLPIVSTEVDNLANLGSSLRTAKDASSMVDAIRTSIANPVNTESAEWQRTMESIAWDTRASNILTIMDRSLRGALKAAA